MPRFLRPYCQWKVDLHYFILQFEKWTAYSNSSILDIMIFWGISMHSFVPHIFYQNQFLCLRWLNRSYCCNVCYLVKPEQYQFYYMKAQFCTWLISIGKYHFAWKLHRLRYGRYPFCRIVQQNMHTIDLLVVLGFKLLSMMR